MALKSLTSILLLSLFFRTQLIHADYHDNFAPIPGWTHETALGDDTKDRHGIILSGKLVSYSSPVIAEIDGNDANGKEVAIVGADGILYVYRAAGTLLWQKDLPNKACTGNALTNKAHSSPAIGDLDGKGTPDVVVGYGGIGGPICHGGVIAFRGSDGAIVFNFSTKTFAKKQRYGANTFSVFSTPALADVDNDGKMEIGFGSFDRNVYLLNFNGTVRWYYNAADTVWSSAAFANVDDEPNLEMIIGTDISANSRLKPPTFNGGFVYAFKTNSRRNKHIAFRDPSAFVWKTYFDQVVQSSPAIADVLSESSGDEIIVGSGCYFPENDDNKTGKWVKILNRKTGTVLKTLSASGCMSASPAVGDLDGDGALDIVISVNGDRSGSGESRSKLTAWKPETGAELWSITPKDGGGNDQYGGTITSPVIADLDGNGSLEVVLANRFSVNIYEGRDGQALSCDERECSGTKQHLYAWRNLRGTPALGDVNQDGKLDVVIGGAHAYARGKGALFGWTGFAGKLGSSASSLAPLSTPWGMFRGNSLRNGAK